MSQKEVLDFLFERRSIRAYKSTEVEEEKIQALLEAAMSSPSAVGKDPWRFIVVRDKKKLKQISEGLPNGQFLADAPLGIVVCGDLKAAHGNQLSYMLQDCAASIENLLLAVNALGLGACWLGVHPREERVKHITEICKVPEQVIPVSCISIGYPDEEKAARNRFDPDKVHYDEW